MLNKLKGVQSAVRTAITAGTVDLTTTMFRQVAEYTVGDNPETHPPTLILNKNIPMLVAFYHYLKAKNRKKLTIPVGGVILPNYTYPISNDNPELDKPLQEMFRAFITTLYSDSSINYNFTLDRITFSMDNKGLRFHLNSK